jgi:hypothetical protein
MAFPLFSAPQHAVNPDLCFVLMPFSAEFKNVYQEIKEAVTDYAGFRCLRADELAVPSKITEDIWLHIQRSRFLIADITGSNANVFYEVGLSHALNKPVILLVREGTEVPFDLKAVRYLHYSPTNFGDLRRNLGAHIKACLECIPTSWNRQNSVDGPEVRITSVEAPASAVVGKSISITVKAKNFGLDATQAYFSLSFPSGASVSAAPKSDVRTKNDAKGDHWTSGQVILDYPIVEAYVWRAPEGPPGWLKNKSHSLTAEVTPSRRGLMQFYVSASAQSGHGPFVNDPKPELGALLDQRDEPVYCGIIEVS